MHGNDHGIIAHWSMHNRQNAGTIFCDCLIGSRAVGVVWIRLDPIRRGDRCFDLFDSNVAYTDRFLRVLGEADHPALPVGLGDLRIDELAEQRFEAFERAFLVRPHQPRVPRHIGSEDRREPTGSGSCLFTDRLPQAGQYELAVLRVTKAREVHNDVGCDLLQALDDRSGFGKPTHVSVASGEKAVGLRK